MGLKLFNRINEASRKAEIARLFVEQQRDDMLGSVRIDLVLDIDTISLEDAMLEESEQQPVFGNARNDVEVCDAFKDRLNGGICEYVEWYYDGENPKLEMN